MMSIYNFADFYNLISRGTQDIDSRKSALLLRKSTLESFSNNGFTKIAFDTRRIDPEVQYNPRRGLQHYTRSTPFMSEDIAQKVKNFTKLRNTLNELKEIYGKENAWQDSNARVLLTAIDSALRTGINDEDFTESQPGVGSFYYLEELLDMRYRLSPSDLENLSETGLKKVILAKDEDLLHKEVKSNLEITKSDVAKQGYDSLVEKLLADCKASPENPRVKRSITITIEDSLEDQDKK